MVKSLLPVPLVISLFRFFSIISAATATGLFLGQPAKISIIYLFFYFPMQIYTAVFLGAVTGVTVKKKTLSSGYLIQVGLCLDLLPVQTQMKQP